MLHTHFYFDCADNMNDDMITFSFNVFGGIRPSIAKQLCVISSNHDNRSYKAQKRCNLYTHTDCSETDHRWGRMAIFNSHYYPFVWVWIHIIVPRPLLNSWSWSLCNFCCHYNLKRWDTAVWHNSNMSEKRVNVLSFVLSEKCYIKVCKPMCTSVFSPLLTLDGTWKSSLAFNSRARAGRALALTHCY